MLYGSHALGIMEMRLTQGNVYPAWFSCSWKKFHRLRRLYVLLGALEEQTVKEPVIKEPSEKLPEESIKPEKTFKNERENYSPGSSGKNNKTKGRVLAWVEKQRPAEPKPTAKNPSSDEVEITMVQPFTSDSHAEIVREVSTDEDEEKAESEENVSKRDIPEPVLRKKEEVHFAGAMFGRTDTMASSIMKDAFVPNTFMEDLNMEQDTKACSSVNKIFNYMLMKTLGRGSYATVKLAYHVPTRKSIAVKIMRKTKESAVFIENEIEIMRGLSHPNIIKLFEVVERRDYTYLVMELASQGALMEQIMEWGPVPEEETPGLFIQVLQAVQYCHSSSIAHMDIKASNILIDHKGNAKLADFGLAFKLEPGEMLVGFRGTPPYCAPEVFGHEPYCGYPADIWSLGVLLFFMVTADYPFGSCREEVRWKVLAADLSIPGFVPKDIFTILKEIFRRDPDGRPTVHQILDFQIVRDWEAYLQRTQTLAGKPSPSIITAVESMGDEPGEIREFRGDQQYGHESPCGDCCEHQAESHSFSVPQRTASEPALPTSLHTRNDTKIGLSGGLSDGSQPSSPLPPVVAPEGSFVGDISIDRTGHPQHATTPSLPSRPHRR